MASHKVKLLGGALALFVSQAAMAVGLGEIKLKSGLNEPLNAEIELLNVGDLSDLEMLIGLASRKDFDRAGVPREFFLTGLQFTIDLSAGKPRVLVKSEKPVREPFLDFLVEMQWPSGRLMREYTLLVDLPIYSDETAKAKVIESTSAGSSQEPSRPAPQRPAPAPKRSVESSSTESSGDVGGDYRVANGDTLWGIARRSRPEGASIHQAMVAIHTMNPRAFARGDINMLKLGEVLRLPASHEITASHRQAVDEIAQQVDSAVSGELIDAVDDPVVEPVLGDSEPEGRLKLYTAVDDEVESDQYSATESDNAENSGAGLGSDVLSNELTIAQEELARKDRELSEERERIAKLEQQLETMQRMIEVGGTGLGETQQELSQTEQVDTEQANVAEQKAPDEEVTSEETATEPTAAAPVNSAAEESWSQYKYHLMAGIAVLMVLLLLLGLRRKKDDGSSDEDEFVFDEEVEPVFAQPEMAVAAAEQTEPEEVEEEQLPPEEVELSDDDQLFSSDAFDMDEEEYDDSDDTDSQDDEGESEEEQGILEDEESTDEYLDFDIDLDLDDDLLASADFDDDSDDDTDILATGESEDEAESLEVESEDDFDLDIDDDEISTKLDLAKAYNDVGDADGAREMLEEVIEEGSEEQQQAAKKLLEDLD